MRIHYLNVEQPKRLSKSIAQQTGAKLMAVQQAVSRASGYRGWHEMDTLVTNQPAFEPPLLAIQDEVSFALRVATELDIRPNDVARGIALAHVFGQVTSTSKSLQIAAQIFRATSIPDRGKRQPGAVGKFKYGSRPMLLRNFGGLTQVLFHRCRNGAIADFEYVTPRNPLPLFIPAALYLAYGYWKLADGSIVLHSRDYLPMWHIIEGRSPKPLNPADWIEHVEQGHFWDDGTAPWDSPKRIEQEHRRLDDFGISGLPKLIDILPDLIYADDHPGIRAAAENRFAATSNSPNFYSG